MHIASLRFDDVRFNPEQGAFEALVRVHDGADDFTYPVHFCAPLTAEFPHISKGLREKALIAHQQGTSDLRLNHTAPGGTRRGYSHAAFRSDRHTSTPHHTGQIAA